MQTLIGFMGGAEEFERRLDYIFIPNTSEQSLDDNGAGITTIMNIGYDQLNILDQQYELTRCKKRAGLCDSV
jgi:hypothetical protein